MASELEPALTRRASRVCPSCDSPGLEIFFEQAGVPVHSCQLVGSRAEAEEFPRGSLVLGLCSSCGFVSNTAFDASSLDYEEDYEETQGFSPRFQEFVHDLATGLVQKYGLRDKDILEIGCGKGEFLALLCELGDNRGVGIDPGVDPARLEGVAGNRLTFVKDFYSERYADLSGDLVVCRHTLEHIQPTGEFLRLLRRSLDRRRETTVFFEVPDTMRILREIAFWDLYYEHCSYFTCGSLARAFRLAGFDVLHLARGFDDQYILIECRPANGTRPRPLELEEEPEELAQAVDEFKAGLASGLARWRRLLREAHARGQRVVLWGSGSKAVSFLTTLGSAAEIGYVVDINPHKHGTYMPPTGQMIVAPEFLMEHRPDLVIVMNPVYREEIQRALAEMGVEARVVALSPAEG